MPTPSNAVRLLIGENEHADWDAYEVDSDLLIPADAWHVSLALPSGALPASIRPGKQVRVYVGPDLVMSGRIDEVSEEVSKDGLRFSIAGRDGAAILLDCASPIFVAKMVSLAEVVAKVVKPLGVTVQAIKGVSRRREKINVDPGDTAWEVLTHAAEANGLWPWFEPDGTLIIGGPDYDAEPVATLVLRKDGKENNVLSLTRQRSVQGRFSEMTVFGQKPGTDMESGKHSLKATAYDTGIDWHRPKVAVDYEADSEAVCLSRARKLLSDSRLKGFTLMASVLGHRIGTANEAKGGALWKPGQRVRVISEPHGVDGVYFLMARKFIGGRNQSAQTQLTLKEDRTWVIDAHPHKKKHRLGKNAAPLQVLDGSRASWDKTVSDHYRVEP